MPVFAHEICAVAAVFVANIFLNSCFDETLKVCTETKNNHKVEMIGIFSIVMNYFELPSFPIFYSLQFYGKYGTWLGPISIGIPDFFDYIK